MLLPGWALTLKCVPVVKVTAGEPVKVKFAVPLLLMVKVWVTGMLPTVRLPKSVSSVEMGVVSPSAIELPNPETSISGGDRLVRL